MITWGDFYNQIVEESNKFDSPLFRGVSNNQYKLQPLLFRDHKGVPISRCDIKQLELQLYTYYKNYSANYHLSHPTLNSWEILYEMRHYGLPTRLLDWTESFAVALYFALRHYNENTTPSIWILNSNKMSELSWGFPLKYDMTADPEQDYEYLFLRYKQDIIPFENPIVIIPSYNQPRLIAQASFFTLHGKNVLPIEEIFDENIVKRINIPPSIIPDARKFLKLTNMNEFSLFPDLGGLKNKIMGNDGFFDRQRNLLKK